VAAGEPTTGSDAEIAEAEPAVAAAEADAPPVGHAASPGSSPEPVGSDRERAKPGPEGLVTVVPGIARYHRAQCILIRFLGADDLETMTRSAAEDADLVPCRACQPEKLG
jgi:hypothetical protein